MEVNKGRYYNGWYYRRGRFQKRYIAIMNRSEITDFMFRREIKIFKLYRTLENITNNFYIPFILSDLMMDFRVQRDNPSAIWKNITNIRIYEEDWDVEDEHIQDYELIGILYSSWNKRICLKRELACLFCDKNNSKKESSFKEEWEEKRIMKNKLNDEIRGRTGTGIWYQEFLEAVKSD